MAVVPLKFRCYQCNGLLGVSRSKVGSVVACPKCRAELIVPDPTEGDGAEPGPAPGTTAATDHGYPLDLLEINPEDIRVEPGVELSPGERAEPAPPREEFHIDSVEPPPPAPPAAPDLPFAPPDPHADPPVPPIRVDAPRISEPRWTPPRSRDVVLPRSAVATWSLFVLIAQALAFVAGLLAGHFLWRVH